MNLTRRSRKKAVSETVSRAEFSTISVKTLNVTTLDKKQYELLQKGILTETTTSRDGLYGAGSLAYTGKYYMEGNLFIGSRQGDKGYIIRSSTNDGTVKLSSLIKKEATNLSGCKLSQSEAKIVIPLPTSVNADTLISETVNAQTGRSSRVNIAATANSVLVIGSANSKRFIQIVVTSDDSRPANKCLSILQKSKEQVSGVIKLVADRDLTIEDYHAMSLRDATECLINCDLKSIIEDFVAQNSRAPSKKSLVTSRSDDLPSKAKFVKRAFGSSIGYLDDADIRSYILNLFKIYIPIMQEAINSENKGSSKKP